MQLLYSIFALVIPLFLFSSLVILPLIGGISCFSSISRFYSDIDTRLQIVQNHIIE